MNPSSLARLKEEQEKGLSECLQKISQWEKFKCDYEALKTRLQSLADKVSYEVMVPFGTQAFMPGRMVHTNEIMVLLGDNWFVERSSKQAAEIVGRRIKQCEKMMEDLDKEKQQLQNWMKYTSEIQESCDVVEIVEEYDAEKEQKWKEEHVKNVRSHKLKLAEERKTTLAHIPESIKSEESLESQIEEELWEKLDRLEMEEAEKQELSNLSEGGHKPLEVVESSPVNETQDGSVEDEEETSEGEDNGKSEEERHVKWQDEEEIKTAHIIFSHTTSSECEPGNSQPSQENKDEESVPMIQSPSDIYKYFENSVSAEEPKSILKTRKDSVEQEKRKPLFDDKESIPIVNVKETYPLPKYQKQRKKENINVTSTSEPAFTGEIQERSVDSTSVSSVHTQESSKSVSRFKAAKQTKK